MCAWVPLLAPGLGTFFVLFFQLLFWDSGPVRGGIGKRSRLALGGGAAAGSSRPPSSGIAAMDAAGLSERHESAQIGSTPRLLYGVLQLQSDTSLAEKWDPARNHDRRAERNYALISR